MLHSQPRRDQKLSKLLANGLRQQQNSAQSPGSQHLFFFPSCREISIQFLLVCNRAINEVLQFLQNVAEPDSFYRGGSIHNKIFM